MAHCNYCYSKTPHTQEGSRVYGINEVAGPRGFPRPCRSRCSPRAAVLLKCTRNDTRGLRGASADEAKRKWGMWWEDAVRSDHWDAVVMLTRMPLVIHDKVAMASTLVQAGMKGNSEAVRRLLAAGVDPNITNTAGDTPLIKSLWRADNLDVVRALLAAGADVNQPDGYRRTPLTKAAWWGRTEVIRLLLQEGGAGLCADPGGRTALTEAAIKGRADAVTLLLALGADPEEADTLGACGRLPLVVAARLEDPAEAEATVRALLKGGANPLATDGAGCCALQVARTSAALRLIGEAIRTT